MVENESFPRSIVSESGKGFRNQTLQKDCSTKIENEKILIKEKEDIINHLKKLEEDDKVSFWPDNIWDIYN